MDDKLVRMSDVERWILTESASIDTPADRDAVMERMRYSIPSVDAVEVRHARWEGNYPQAKFRLKRCSACETLAPEGWYCFFCGARMDGLYESLKRGLEEAIAYENGEIECRTETRKEDSDEHFD